MLSFELETLHKPSRAHASRKDLAALVAFVLEQQKVLGRCSVAVRIVDDATIQEWSRHYVGEDHVTDVITFPYRDAPNLEVDIAICGPQAARQGKDVGHGTKNEIRLLVIHGLLHCLGFDDHAPAKRKRMFKRQAQLLRTWINR